MSLHDKTCVIHVQHHKDMKVRRYKQPLDYEVEDMIEMPRSEIERAFEVSSCEDELREIFGKYL